MDEQTAAVLGVAGGVGATRLSVELGATLARDGRSAAVIDAAFGTQGLARHVAGRVEPDVTDLLVERRSLEGGLADHPADGELPGRLALCAAHTPYLGLADANAPDAAAHLETLAAEAADAFDHVLLDTPPVASNPAVAAVTAADRVAAVTLPGERGVDALQRARGRVADVGAAIDLVVANRVPEGVDAPDADLTIPSENMPAPGALPAACDAGGPVAPAIATTAEALFDVRLDHEFEAGLLERAANSVGP